jgi:hypothetical protein
VKIDFSIRLVLCANGVPVGARLHRDKPFPKYEHTYEDTAGGRERAEADLARIQKYMDENDRKGR